MYSVYNMYHLLKFFVKHYEIFLRHMTSFLEDLPNFCSCVTSLFFFYETNSKVKTRTSFTWPLLIYFSPFKNNRRNVLLTAFV